MNHHSTPNSPLAGAAASSSPRAVTRPAPDDRRPRPVRPRPSSRFTAALLLLAAVAAAVAAAPVLAGVTTTTAAATAGGAPALADTAGAVLAPVVEALAGQHGWLLQGLTLMASLRTVFKPVMTAVQAATGGTSLGAGVSQFQSSFAGRAVSFLLDLGASVKLHLVLPAAPAAKPGPTTPATPTAPPPAAS